MFWSFYLYGRFETGRFKTWLFETWRFVNLTFCKPDVLKPDVLKPDIVKPDVFFLTWRFVGVPFFQQPLFDSLLLSVGFDYQVQLSVVVVGCWKVECSLFPMSVPISAWLLPARNSELSALLWLLLYLLGPAKPA
jgi:hypothetical protein